MRDVLSKEKVVRLSNKKEKLLTEEQYEEYLYKLKEHDENSWLGTMSLHQRMRFHGILRFLLRADRISKRIKVRKLNNMVPKIPKGRQAIFVLTHVGRDDIAIFNEVVGEHYTILSGDYESLHNNVEWFVFALNGTLFFNMKSQEERGTIEDKVVKILNEGDNILCSMEAAWNLSANEIVMELFPGMIRAAIKSNSVIIPVGIERFTYRLYGINMASKVFEPNDYVDKYKNIDVAIEEARHDLRQIMADLKFQTYYEDYIQKEISVSRKSIGDYCAYDKVFKEDILRGWTFTEEIVNSKKYRNRAKPQYAFSYVVDMYRFRLKKFANYRVMCELIREINNPVYPTCITESLRELLLEFMHDN